MLSSEGPRPARVTRGQTVTLNVESSVPLERSVELSAVATGLPTVPFELESNDGTRFSFRLTVDERFSEGTITLLGAAVTPQGAVVENVRLGTFEVDLTPPSLLKSSLSATVVRPGARVSVQAELDEPIEPAVRLRVEWPGAAPLDLEPESLGSGLISFGFTVPVGTANGAARLSLREVRDVAGNAADELMLRSLEVDAKPPVLEPLGVEGRTFSAMPGFNQLTVVARADEAAALEVCLGDRPCVAPGAEGTTTFTITTADPEGPQFVVVRGTDPAGNVSLVSAAVVFDFTPPSVTTLSSALVPPPGCPLRTVTSLGPEGRFELQFAVSETLAAPPEVRFDGSLTIPARSSSAGVFLYALQLTTVSNRVGAVTTRLVDTVGNGVDLQLLSRLELDGVNPPVLSDAELDTVLYERAPWGLEETGYQPRFSVVVDAGAGTPGETLLFFDEPSPTATVVGRGERTDAGVLERVVLTSGDRQRLWLRRVDGACNGSTLQVIRHNDWVATNSEAANEPSALATLRDHSDLAPNDVRNGTWPALPGEQNALDGPLVWQPLSTERTLPALAHSGFEAVFNAATRRLVWFGGASPPPRGNGASIYDNAGGWYDGVALRSMVPSGPLGRVGHSMVYDPKHRRVVMFGGTQPEQSGLPFTDAWALERETWVRIEVPPSVRPTQGAVLSYDESRRALLLIGGGVWRLDDDDFTGLSAPPDIIAMTSLLALWDPFARRTIVTGSTGFSAAPVTYAEQNGVWTKLAGPQPPPRTGGRILVDEAQRRLLVFGGASVTTAQPMRDLWALEGSTWRQLSVPGSSLENADGVHERATGRTIFVGTEDDELVDTYALTDAGFTFIGTSDGFGDRLSTRRLFYDPVRERVVRLETTLVEDYTVRAGYELVGDQWVSIEQTSPLAEFNVGSEDPTRGHLVLFGRRRITPYDLPSPNRTALLDERGLQFVATPSALQNRFGAMTAFDPENGRLVLYGGSNGTTPVSDTWTFDGTSWVQLTTPTALTARSDAALVHDPAGHRLLLVGGRVAGSTVKDVWALSGSAWSQLAVPTGFQARSGAAVFFDTSRSKTVISAGTDSFSALRDTWELTASTFTPGTTAVGPSGSVPFARFDAPAAFGLTQSNTSSVGVQTPLYAFEAGTWTTLTLPWTNTRGSFGVASEPRAGGFVLFGGSGQGLLNETSLLSRPNRWSTVTPHPDLLPRLYPLLVTDRARNRVVLAGGEGQQQLDGFTQRAFYGELWSLAPSPTLGPSYALHFRPAAALPSTDSIQSVRLSVWGSGDSTFSSMALAPGANRLPDGGARFLDGGAAPAPVFTVTDAPGIRLDTWDSHTGRLLTLGVGGSGTDAGTSAPVTATFLRNGGGVDAGGHALLERLVEEDAFTVQLTTRGGADPRPGAGPPRLIFDRYELRVRYRND